MSTNDWKVPLKNEYPADNQDVYLRISCKRVCAKGYLGDDGYWHLANTNKRLKSHAVTGWKACDGGSSCN